ncbi:uncharacterized protein V6R79_015299 [Siganus canaliculatus]
MVQMVYLSQLEDSYSALSSSQESADSEEDAMGLDWMSRDGRISWSLIPRASPGNIFSILPGAVPWPTHFVVRWVSTIRFAFELFITDDMVMYLSNGIQGRRTRSDFVNITTVTIQAYIEPLILAGVSRSRNEQTPRRSTSADPTRGCLF